MKGLSWMGVLALLIGCSSGGGSGPGTTDTGYTNDKGASDMGGDAEVELAHFTGILVDFQSKSPKKGVDLLVLNNETGEPIDLEKYAPFKSGDGGAIDLYLPKGILVGFKAWGQDESGFFKFKHSYQFNIPSDARDKRIYAVNELTYAAALSTAFVKEVDPSKYGHLAGTLYYVNEKGEEEFIGCATIQVLDENGSVLEEQTDEDGRATFCGVRYFDTKTDMPTSLAISDMTHKLNSRYMVANLPSGKYTIRATLEDTGEVLGEVTLRPFPGSISIGNIYVHGPNNPTPDRAECIGEEQE